MRGPVGIESAPFESDRSVCLIIPPSPFLLDERVFMSLGILRIAAVLEQAAISVEVVDLSGVENYCDAVRDHARSTDAQFFGITATTPQMPAVAAIRDVLRAERPDARLVNAAAKRERMTPNPACF